MNAVITAGYTSDLLSDVMGNAPDKSVLITIQAHKNTVAVASLAGITAIVLCNGRTIPDDMREAAENEGISLLGTEKDQFTASAVIARELEIV
ncbi:MAG: iron-sulfur binding hydrogenase [Spirochaetia bacterium]